MTSQHKRAALNIFFFLCLFVPAYNFFFSFRLYSRSLARGALRDWIFLNFLSRPSNLSIFILVLFASDDRPAAPRLFTRLTYVHLFSFSPPLFHLNSETCAALPGCSRPPTASHLFLSRASSENLPRLAISPNTSGHPPHRGSVPIHCFILDTYPKKFANSHCSLLFGSQLATQLALQSS